MMEGKGIEEKENFLGEFKRQTKNDAEEESVKRL